MSSSLIPTQGAQHDVETLRLRVTELVTVHQAEERSEASGGKATVAKGNGKR